MPSLQVLLKDIKSYNTYVLYSKSIDKSKLTDIKLNLNTIRQIEKVKEFEISYYQNFDENGAVIIILEHLIKYSKLKNWENISSILTSLLSFFLECLLVLIDVNAKWQKFYLTIFKLLKSVWRKHISYPSNLIEKMGKDILFLSNNEKLSLLQRYNILHFFQLCSDHCSRDMRAKLLKDTQYKSYLDSLADALLECGFFPLQFTILFTLLRWLTNQDEIDFKKKVLSTMFSEKSYKSEAIEVFLHRQWKSASFEDARAFLNAQNEGSSLVTSVLCQKIIIGDIKLMFDKKDGLKFMDVNNGNKSISILLHPSSLKPFGFEKYWACESIILRDEDITTIHVQRNKVATKILISGIAKLYPTLEYEITSKLLEIEINNNDTDKTLSALRATFGEKFMERETRKANYGVILLHNGSSCAMSNSINKIQSQQQGSSSSSFLTKDRQDISTSSKFFNVSGIIPKGNTAIKNMSAGLESYFDPDISICDESRHDTSCLKFDENQAINNGNQQTKRRGAHIGVLNINNEMEQEKEKTKAKPAKKKLVKNIAKTKKKERVKNSLLDKSNNKENSLKISDSESSISYYLVNNVVKPSSVPQKSLEQEFDSLFNNVDSKNIYVSPTYARKVNLSSDDEETSLKEYHKLLTKASQNNNCLNINNKSEPIIKKKRKLYTRSGNVDIIQTNDDVDWNPPKRKTKKTCSRNAVKRKVDIKLNDPYEISNISNGNSDSDFEIPKNTNSKSFKKFTSYTSNERNSKQSNSNKSLENTSYKYQKTKIKQKTVQSVKKPILNGFGNHVSKNTKIENVSNLLVDERMRNEISFKECYVVIDDNKQVKNTSKEPKLTSVPTMEIVTDPNEDLNQDKIVETFSDENKINGNSKDSNISELLIEKEPNCKDTNTHENTLIAMIEKKVNLSEKSHPDLRSKTKVKNIQELQPRKETTSHKRCNEFLNSIVNTSVKTPSSNSSIQKVAPTDSFSSSPLAGSGISKRSTFESSNNSAKNNMLEKSNSEHSSISEIIDTSYNISKQSKPSPVGNMAKNIQSEKSNSSNKSRSPIVKLTRLSADQLSDISKSNSKRNVSMKGRESKTNKKEQNLPDKPIRSKICKINLPDLFKDQTFNKKDVSPKAKPEELSVKKSQRTTVISPLLSFEEMKKAFDKNNKENTFAGNKNSTPRSLSSKSTPKNTVSIVPSVSKNKVTNKDTSKNFAVINDKTQTVGIKKTVNSKKASPGVNNVDKSNTTSKSSSKVSSVSREKTILGNCNITLRSKLRQESVIREKSFHDWLDQSQTALSSQNEDEPLSSVLEEIKTTLETSINSINDKTEEKLKAAIMDLQKMLKSRFVSSMAQLESKVKVFLKETLKETSRCIDENNLQCTQTFNDRIEKIFQEDQNRKEMVMDLIKNQICKQSCKEK